MCRCVKSLTFHISRLSPGDYFINIFDAKLCLYLPVAALGVQGSVVSMRFLVDPTGYILKACGKYVSYFRDTEKSQSTCIHVSI